MLKAILPAAFSSLLFASAAWAYPVAVVDGQGSAAIKVDDHHHDDHHGGGHHDDHHADWHGHGGRYHYGNRDWGHRYSHRPNNWQTLGCMAVGPVWYCP